MSMVHASSGFLAPPSDQVRSEPAIIAGLAKATLGARSGVDWNALVGDYALIRNKIEAVFPEFEGYNQRIREPGGFQLPNAAQQRLWKTDSGRANFAVFAGLEEDGAAPADGVLTLTTLRSHDQYNTTVYGLDDRYRGVFGRRDVLFINDAELARRGLQEGDVVDVCTAGAHAHSDREVSGLMLVRYDLPDGCCAAYYPETQPLIALEHVDPDSLTPAYKSVPVSLRRSNGRGDAPVAVGRGGVAGSAEGQGLGAVTPPLASSRPA
jgi:anaerobic selenocysteine-containing dehydrogenase